ncbi:MAG: 30S ribosomal protein S20 [Verrucomicrobiales bacterium]|jgi:small subunit ribosomal protein S20|nr:30S ribosomal protein S20 [Verrucomicrobiales bacterium]
MANSRSALKRVRQTKTRTLRNRALKTSLKSLRKDALAAVEAGDSKKAQESYNQFASAADKAAKKGALHKNTASRLKSRVATKVNAIGS